MTISVIKPLDRIAFPAPGQPIEQLGPHYLTKLAVQALGDGKHWMLLQPLIVMVPGYGVIEVEEGFVFDFASIPRIARWLYQPATGRHRASACVHDWIYETAKFPRTDCDEIFRILNELDGVHFISNQLMFSAVRSGGWMVWNKRHGGN